MSTKKWSFTVGQYEVPDMKYVRKYRAFIQDVIDGTVLCYVPSFVQSIKAIQARINLLSKRLDRINEYLNDGWNTQNERQRDAVVQELRMYYEDKRRTELMSASVDRKAIDRNLRMLHKSAQYLYRWGFIETYTINKGMISGVWFDGYTKPERQPFDTLKWEVVYNENPAHIAHDCITKNPAEMVRDKIEAQKDREQMFHNPTPPTNIALGDWHWSDNSYRVRPVVHQESAKTLMRRIRRKRKMPLFLNTFKAWEK